MPLHSYKKPESSNRSIIILYVLLLVLSCLIFYRPIETEDIWWHMATGRWIAEHNSVPQHDIFSYDNQYVYGICHQWLGSWLFYQLHQFAGLEGLKIFRVIMLLIVFVLFLIWARRKVPLYVLLALSAPLMVILAQRSLLRPFFFNFIFIQLFLILLLNSQKKFTTKSVWILPLINILWLNMHIMGSFIYGIGLIACFLCADLIQWIQIFVKKEGTNNLQQKKAIREHATRLSLVFFTFLLSFFINPYGLEGFLFPYRVLLVESYYEFDLIRKTIQEFQPLNLTSLRAINVLPLGFGMLIAAIYNKRDRPTILPLMLFSLLILNNGQRGAPFFAMTACYIIVISWSLLPAAIIRNRYKNKPLNLLFCLILAAAMLFKIYDLVTKKYPDNNRRLNIIEAKVCNDNPAIIVQKMIENNLTGKIFCQDSYSGYIFWSVYPKLKPFSDTRQFNSTMFIWYLHMQNFPEKYWDLARRRFGFKIALIDQSQSRLMPFLENHPHWKETLSVGPAKVFVYVK